MLKTKAGIFYTTQSTNRNAEFFANCFDFSVQFSGPYLGLPEKKNSHGYFPQKVFSCDYFFAVQVQSDFSQTLNVISTTFSE